MKTKVISAWFAFIMMIGGLLVSNKVQAQENKKQENYPATLSAFYIGATGGYLFENNLATDPAYYLSSGYFAELNLGWRASSSFWGWELNAGRLAIKRELPFTGNTAYAIEAEKVMKNQSNSWMWANATYDNRTFNFPAGDRSISEVADLGSWYALTGPKFWFGGNKLQGFVGLNAGVGMTKYGYYYIEGVGRSANTLDYTYTSKGGAEVGPVDVRLVDNQYSQYGMSSDTYNSMTSSPFSVDEKAEFHLIARGTVGLTYFITPKLSLNASASYWYIPAPDWKSEASAGSILLFNGEIPSGFKPVPGANDPYLNLTGTGGTVNGSAQYLYEEKFDAPDIGYISANIGIKYWFGNVKKSEKTEEEPVVQKDLLVTVKDGPTGLALSNVEVTVYKNGEEFYTGITDANGAIPTIDNIEPGNYKIKGRLNSVNSTVASINSEDFENDARILHRTLTHTDLRFTLVGHTLRAETDEAVSAVKTTLTNENNSNNTFQTSDDEGEFRFQLEPNTDFSVFAEHKGYFSNREKVSTKGLNRSKTIYVDLHLGLSKLIAGKSFELKNIYYDFDKANIRPEAAKVLNDVYRLMVNNPTLEIELASHTDSRGSDSYNLSLSQRRAESAVNYLVDKGISINRLVARGYGETRLINKCEDGVPCSDAQHQANRRTTIKVLNE